MLNIRFRNKTNAWPGFIDLFSNLVIILIFLLIVFIFLWLTTSTFNSQKGAKRIANLQQENQEQLAQIQELQETKQEATELLVRARQELENQEQESQQITDLQSEKQEASELLIRARQELENLNEKNSNLTKSNEQLNSELQEMNLSLRDLLSAYENRLVSLQDHEQNLQATIDSLTTQFNLKIEEQQRVFDDRQAKLSEQLTSLQEALDASEAKSKNQEIQYLEMSNRLNKALSDKIAELNTVSAYQSEFYKSVKNALGDRTTIQQDGDRFIISSDILFASGSYKLSDKGKQQLYLISNIIRGLEEKIPSDVNWIIRIDGHTDKKAVLAGTNGYKNNTELSLLRATAVAKELEKHGVSKRRLLPSGFGELYPIALGNDATSLQQNRRIELQLTNR